MPRYAFADLKLRNKSFFERSEAEGRAELAIGLAKKKKWTKKKGTTTTTNFVPGQTFYLFFLNFHTYVPSFHSKKYLWSLLRTNSLQKTSWRKLLWEKKVFLKKNSKIFFEKKIQKYFFRKKNSNFFFFEKIFLNFFFFEKMFFDFNLKLKCTGRAKRFFDLLFLLLEENEL